jgi:hypothetical protein
MLMQDRCMVCVERTIGSESFWKPPIELLGDMRQLESHFVPFGDSGARFFPNAIQARKLFWKSPRLKWKLNSVCLDILLLLTQDSA